MALSWSFLAEVLLDVVLETPKMIVLGDCSFQAEATLPGPAQDFIVKNC